MATIASQIPQSASSAEPAGTDDSGSQHIAWLASRARGTFTESRKYLLVMRFSLINLVAFTMLGVAYLNGYVGMVIAADQTRLSFVIFAAFAAGLALCGSKVFATSKQLNAVSDFDALSDSEVARYLAKLRGQNGESRSIIAGTMRLRLSHRIAVVRNVANSLVLLGLIGTVIGFVIALSGIDPARASEFESISPMVSTLIRGMSTALYTTLVGAVFNLWLMVNYHLLATGTVKLITAIQEFGEKNARA